MDLENYLAKYGASMPSASVSYLRSLVTAALYTHRRGVLLASGLLQFDAETAFCWGRPWPGGFAAFRLMDHRETLAVFPIRQDRGGKSIAPSNKLVDVGDLHMARLRQTRHPGPQDMVSSAKPFELKLFGNDDTTWSKFYATAEEAREELHLFEFAQPLNYYEVVHDFGFAFTN